MNPAGPASRKRPARLPPENTGCPLIVTATDTCRAAISLHAAAAEDGREAGGILLGHHHDRPQSVIDVVHAGDAGPRSVRQISLFRRDVAHAQALADLAYSTDGSIWLGEWHTHPRGLSQPSRLDLTSYQRMLADPELGFTFFLAVIVLPSQAGGWHHPCLNGWVISTADIWPVRLQPRTHAQGPA
jgi:integrative and conjugative element protein (TIGR02256 family)